MQEVESKSEDDGSSTNIISNTQPAETPKEIDISTNLNSTDNSNVVDTSNTAIGLDTSNSNSDSNSNSTTNSNVVTTSLKRKAKKDDLRKVTKVAKKDTKRIPNIAEELAKNRNQVKATSPSPVHMLSSSPMLPQQSQGSSIDASMAGDKTTLQKKERKNKKEKVIKKEVLVKTEPIKISSLLSPNEDSKKSATTSPQAILLTADTSSLSQQGTIGPKVILPTQKPGNTVLDKTDSLDDTGVLVARLSSPVNLPEKLTPSLKKSHSTVAPTPEATAVSASSTPAPSTTITKATPNSLSKTTAAKAKKSKSASAVPSKSKASNNSKSRNDTKKKTNTKTQKKASPAPLNTDNVTSEKDGLSTNDKKDDKKKASPKLVNTKKDVSNGPNKQADNKKKSNFKKEQVTTTATKPKTPKKLVVPPPIKSPSLLDVFERGKPTKDDEDPIVIVDVPLFSSKDNEYLDENGQVVFNYYKLVQDKLASQNKTSMSVEKLAKRNLLGQLNHTTSNVESLEAIEGDDIADEEEDGDDEEEEEVDEEKTATPKKRPHSNKGKSLIGKYDIEDPFIDDSELLWEEQRAATKDGFFVFFGPLIEKGHYASLERVDGTMKRGGVKNK